MPRTVTSSCDPTSYATLVAGTRTHGFHPRPRTKRNLCDSLRQTDEFTDWTPQIIVGDIEGSARYLARLMSISTHYIAATFHTARGARTASEYADIETPQAGADDLERIELDFVHENAHLVVLGDSVDRGDANMYSSRTLHADADDEQIAQALLALKGAHPSRVHLLAGNRELTKLRMIEALEDRTYWNDETKDAVREQRRILEEHSARIRGLIEQRAPAAEVAAAENARFKVARKFSMGVMQDLSTERADYAAAMTPGGWMFEYLRACDLICRVGNTLYVHGAVTPHNFLLVPAGFESDLPVEQRSQETQGKPRMPDCMVMDIVAGGSVDAWVAQLNHWFHRTIQTCLRPLVADPANLLLLQRFDEGSVNTARARLLAAHRREVRALTDLALGDNVAATFCNRNAFTRDPARTGKVKSVVAADNTEALAAQFSPTTPQGRAFRALAESLIAAGVERVLSGHKPLGKTPVVIAYSGADGADRTLDFYLCSIDTSYSACSGPPGRADSDTQAIRNFPTGTRYSGTATHTDGSEAVLYRADVRLGERVEGQPGSITNNTLALTAHAEGIQSHAAFSIFYDLAVKGFACPTVFAPDL